MTEKALFDIGQSKADVEFAHGSKVGEEERRGKGEARREIPCCLKAERVREQDTNFFGS